MEGPSTIPPRNHRTGAKCLEGAKTKELRPWNHRLLVIRGGLSLGVVEVEEG